MIRDDADGRLLTQRDQFGDELVLDPRDVTWSDQGYFVTLEFPDRAQAPSVWLTKEMIVDLRAALADALTNIERQEAHERC